jgi:hypothetical protein
MKQHMRDSRSEPRLMCADMVEITWEDKSGRAHQASELLEDILLSGACLQVDERVPFGTEVCLIYPKGSLDGKVRCCIFRDIGYFVGVQFRPGSKWSQRHYKPQHLLDPRKLIRKR